MKRNCVDCLIVGGGKMGLLHGALINRVSGLRVSGIVDPSFQSRSVAKGIGISVPIFSSVESAIRKLDAGIAIICTPPKSHFSLTKKFMENGWGVFVEKPLTMDSNLSQELVDFAIKHDLYNQVGFQLRFNPAVRFLYDYMNEKDSDILRRIDSLEIEILSPQFSKITDQNMGLVRGGVEWDLLPHVVDLAFYLMNVKRDGILSISKTRKDSWKSISTEIGLKEANIKLIADWANNSVRKVETKGELVLIGGSRIYFDMDKVCLNEEVLFHRRAQENPFFEIADQEYSFQIGHLSDNVSDSPRGPAAGFESGLLVDWAIGEMRDVES